MHSTSRQEARASDIPELQGLGIKSGTAKVPTEAKVREIIRLCAPELRQWQEEQRRHQDEAV